MKFCVATRVWVVAHPLKSKIVTRTIVRKIRLILSTSRFSAEIVAIMSNSGNSSLHWALISLQVRTYTPKATTLTAAEEYAHNETALSWKTDGILQMTSLNEWSLTIDWLCDNELNMMIYYFLWHKSSCSIQFPRLLTDLGRNRKWEKHYRHRIRWLRGIESELNWQWCGGKWRMTHWKIRRHIHSTIVIRHRNREESINSNGKNGEWTSSNSHFRKELKDNEWTITITDLETIIMLQFQLFIVWPR